MPAKPTPYAVTVHDILKRKPVTVGAGHEYSRHASEAAGRRAAKNAARGCIFNGPSNVAILTGPDGLREVWWKGTSESARGSYITLRTAAYRHTGPIVISEEVPDAR